MYPYSVHSRVACTVHATVGSLVVCVHCSRRFLVGLNAFRERVICAVMPADVMAALAELSPVNGPIPLLDRRRSGAQSQSPHTALLEGLDTKTLARLERLPLEQALATVESCSRARATVGRWTDGMRPAPRVSFSSSMAAGRTAAGCPGSPACAYEVAIVRAGGMDTALGVGVGMASYFTDSAHTNGGDADAALEAQARIWIDALPQLPVSEAHRLQQLDSTSVRQASRPASHLTECSLMNAPYSYSLARSLTSG